MMVVLVAAGCASSSSNTTKTAASAPAQAPSSTSSVPVASGGVTVSTKHGKLGTILAAGPKRMTVYLFEGDTGPASACSGTCATAWPPVTTTGEPKTSGSAVAADLGTITRPEGIKQVTYKGHPLYYFEKDGDAGDAYGQGSKAFGASWYVLGPAGSKVDHS
jgi:predicted lipoprotein with Yx(FWY)xxD motif